MITLIGLGIAEGDLTLSAKAALDKADVILARTASCAAFGSLKGYKVAALDGVKATAKSFGELCEELAARVTGEKGDVCYCVDGAVSDDKSCEIILEKCKDVAVCEGVSRASAIKTAAKMRSGAVTVLSSADIGTLKSCRAAIVYNLCDRQTAEEVKRVLSDLFGGQSFCSFVAGNSAKCVRVCEIDSQSGYGADCAVAVEEAEFLKKERYDFDDLCKMIELLRAPNGCPWDGAQTAESIKSNAVEEAYELADAIERGDDAGVLEETGDVLLQAAFHSVLKKEAGVFNAGDAITGVVKKLIFRHSHIFGKDKASSESEALGVWDKNKAVEKHMSTFGESVSAVPKNFPACMRAQKVGKRAGKSGMDFLSPVSASEKLWEEVKEMVAAMQSGDKRLTFEEAGDVLFSAVNVCRLAGVDCEEALRAATDKFVKRFVECEKLVIADGKDITELDELALNYYWMLAKNVT